MVDPIIKRRIRARSLNIPFRGRRICGNWAEHALGHPVGYRHRSLANIPKSHLSSKVLQDQIEATMNYKIRHTPPGPRKDFMIRDLNLWIANGRPTSTNNSMTYKDEHGRQVMDKDAEAVNTWHGGKPLSSDLDDLYGREKARRLARLLATDQ